MYKRTCTHMHIHVHTHTPNSPIPWSSTPLSYNAWEQGYTQSQPSSPVPSDCGPLCSPACLSSVLVEEENTNPWTVQLAPLRLQGPNTPILFLFSSFSTVHTYTTLTLMWAHMYNTLLNLIFTSVQERESRRKGRGQAQRGERERKRGREMEETEGQLA